jgi:hypothetical protein
MTYGAKGDDDNIDCNGMMGDNDDNDDNDGNSVMGNDDDNGDGRMMVTA